MIISHKHKFIFIKPQKTAGTSVELMLSRICGDDDVITPLGFDPDPNVREKHNAKPPQNFYRSKPFKHWQISEVYHWITKQRKPNLNYWEHLQADLIKQYVGSDIWNSYKKISIVRNPWDHAVSWYKWQHKFDFENARKMTFEEYLINNYRSLWQFYTIKYGIYNIDYMIKFETLREDVDKLFEVLRLDTSQTLPKTKSNINKTKNYKEFYLNNNMIEIVKEKSLQTINKFEYQF